MRVLLIFLCPLIVMSRDQVYRIIATHFRYVLNLFQPGAASIKDGEEIFCSQYLYKAMVENSDAKNISDIFHRRLTHYAM